MSRHWKPADSPRRRSWTASTRGKRRGRRGKSALGFGEIRLLLLGGAFLGLAYAAATSTPVAIPELRWSGTSERSERIDAAAIEVIDGDTFEYRGEKIRIADIDTPEVRGRCPYETALAARATDRMGELLAAGPFELKAVGRDEDRYGRKLRIVIRDRRSLGDQLVAEGLARTWTGRREPWCA